MENDETKLFIENHVSRRYIGDGVPAFADRTKEERVKYCRRINGFYLGLDGIAFTREKPCHVFKGEVVCENCLRYRIYRRASGYIDRLSAVKDSALSFARVSSKKELENLSRAAKRRGYEVMALPISEGDEYKKMVFVDGFFDHAGEFGQLKRINYNDAVEVTSSFAPLFSDKKVSGKLGKMAAVLTDIVSDVKTVLVDHRIILFNGKNPSYYQNSLAYAMAIKSLGQDTLATENNIQRLVTAREDVLMEAYKAIGLLPFFGKTVETKRYRVDEIADRWMYIDGGTAGVHGNLDALDSFTKELVQQITDEYSAAIENIDFIMIAQKSMKEVADRFNLDDTALVDSEMG